MYSVYCNEIGEHVLITDGFEEREEAQAVADSLNLEAHYHGGYEPFWFFVKNAKGKGVDSPQDGDYDHD